jgi:hypothetical protein
MRKAAWALALLAVLGCGQDTSPGLQPAPASPPKSATHARPAATHITARVRVVDVDGQPLPGMTPIATVQANAFDAPVATGPPTGADGVSSIALPAGGWLCVRAWDPNRRMFANNYFDVLPGDGERVEDMDVVMAPGASLEVALVSPEGTLAASENVGLMMFHPTKGPWWPGEADTDANGHVRFDCVPAGKYTIKLKALRSGQIEVGEVTLSPGGSTDLGTVTLR